MATENPAEGTPASAPDPAAEEAAYKAGLARMLSGEEEPATEEVPKPEGEPAEAEPTTDEEEPEAEDAAEAEETEGEPETEVDQEALRKLSKEKRTFEKHKTAVLEKERAVVAREQRVLEVEKKWTEFAGDMDANGVEALLRRGIIPEAEISTWARQLFLMTPEALKDPRSKVEAERLRRDMAQAAEARRIKNEVETLRREREEEKVAREEERQLNEYTSRIKATTTVFKAKTPLLTKSMEKDAEATERELYQVAHDLAVANGGRLAEPGAVVLAWEKRQREMLARLGFQTPATPAVQTKAKTPTAAKSQGQPPKKKDSPAAEEPADDKPLEGEAYMAELRRRLKQS